MQRTSLVRFTAVTQIPSYDGLPKVISVPKMKAFVGIEIEYRGCAPDSMVYKARTMRPLIRGMADRQIRPWPGRIKGKVEVDQFLQAPLQLITFCPLCAPVGSIIAL